ncbi:MAG: hypothetical protein KC900_09285 [Candidatus Omnitrophica bacterium]|nr:hypothetical protein [Candidatus Omnitrophota bacterium]
MKINNSDGYLLIMSLAVALFLTILLGAAFVRSTQQLREADQRRAVHQAFSTAEAGIDRALFEFRRDPDWGLGTDPDMPNMAVSNVLLNAVEADDTTVIGTYSIEVVNGPDIEDLGETRWVRSVGYDAESNLNRAILARVLIDDPSRFLLSTPGALRFKSGAVVEADVLGQDLFFDVNDALPDAAQRHITIDGNVLYIDELNPSNPQSDPDITITGAVNPYPSVTFPGVDINRYDTLATGLAATLGGYKEAGDLTIDLDNLGALDGTPGFAPRLIFATGDIRVSGEFDTSLLLVAGGNIYIEGDIVPDPLTPDAQIGLFAKQDVVIPDGAVAGGADLTVEAFVIADGSDGANGEFRAESTVGLGEFNFTGAISVRGGGGTQTGIDLSVFAVRNYTHKANIAVPFSPFIANIITWQETTSFADFPPP